MGNNICKKRNAEVVSSDNNINNNSKDDNNTKFPTEEPVPKIVPEKRDVATQTPQWFRLHPIPLDFSQQKSPTRNRCIATATSTGERCKNNAIKDLPVCGVHQHKFIQKFMRRSDSHWAPRGYSWQG